MSSTTSSSSAVGTPGSSFFGRNEFLIRRVHSLSGLLPVGLYMTMHLVVNSTILLGPETFQAQVDQINSLGKLLPFVEWPFIFLPLIFHAVVGVWICFEANPNTANYPFTRNWRYTLQRVTGMIAFFYILFHILHMHRYGMPLNAMVGAAPGAAFARFDHHEAAATAAAALAPVFIKAIYAVGVLACVFHFANGLWTMGITWGVWVSPKAQRRADVLITGFGVAVLCIGWAAIFGFSNTRAKPAVSESHVQRAPAVVETTPGGRDDSRAVPASTRQ